MKFLLDTHIWIWCLREPHRLSPPVHQALTDPGNTMFLSPISIWEVMILLEKHRLQIHEDFARWFERTTEDLQLEEAPFNWKVVHQVRYVLPDHNDPADRFLAATAIVYDLTLVTADQRLTRVPNLKVLANA